MTRRPAVAEDEAFIRALIVQMVSDELLAYAWPEAMRGPLLDMQYRARMAGMKVSFPGAEHEIILADGEAAGWMVTARGDDAITLADIAVAPEHRGKGLAAAAIGELLAESKRTGKPVELQVTSMNPAIRLYERLGFRKTGSDEIRQQMVWP